jgi:hypothetical protein
MVTPGLPHDGEGRGFVYDLPLPSEPLGNFLKLIGT